MLSRFYIKGYMDTEDGALKYFHDETGAPIAGATAVRDPQVCGVWLITLAHGQRCVVYLAGYRTRAGNFREYNDLEMED